jgi:hypothetical protein
MSVAAAALIAMNAATYISGRSPSTANTTYTRLMNNTGQADVKAACISLTIGHRIKACPFVSI